MVALLVILSHTLGFLSSLHAVMTNRTAQGAIAWGLSLNTFPYLTVPLYWVFGLRKFEGYLEAWENQRKDIDALVASIHDALAPFEVRSFDRLPNYEALKKIAQTPLLYGNEVELRRLSPASSRAWSAPGGTRSCSSISFGTTASDGASKAR